MVCATGFWLTSCMAQHGTCVRDDEVISRVPSSAQQPDTPLTAAVPASAATEGSPALKSFIFMRPSDCGSFDRKWGQRLATCARENQIEVTIHADGSVTSAETGDSAPRNPYPYELNRQWRYCPFERVDALDRLGEHFFFYQDPFIGGCYIFRDLPAAEVEAVRKSAGLAVMDGVHPYIADAITRLIIHAKREGINVRVISGLRSHTVGTVTRAGKKVRIRKPTLHTFGLAVDVILSHRKSLSDATRAYINDPAERKAWERIGELGSEYGLIWLGTMSSAEIFHFEWHPGVTGLMKGKPRMSAMALMKKRGVSAVWKLLEYDPAKKTPMKHLVD